MLYSFDRLHKCLYITGHLLVQQGKRMRCIKWRLCAPCAVRAGAAGTLCRAAGSEVASAPDSRSRLRGARRRFLLSFKEGGEPDWTLLDVPVAAALPKVRWRMANLARLDGTRWGEITDSADTALGRAGGGMSVAQSKDKER